MSDEPDKPRDDPARSWDDEGMLAATDLDPAAGEDDTAAPPVDEETVGTGSYVAVSCVAAMGLLLVILIVGLLISRWIG